MNPSQLIDILALCPWLHTVSTRPSFGPQDIRFWSDLLPPYRSQISDVMFPSIKRLDWSSACANYEVQRASGIPLANITLRTPNLRYLTTASWPDPVFDVIDRSVHPILFPSLTTLRLERYTTLFKAGIRRHDVPNLTHLILQSLNIIVASEPTVIDVIGPQLRVVELEDLNRDEPVNATQFFRRCPTLREFAYHVGVPQLLINPLNYPSLKTVHLAIDKLHDFRENHPHYYSSGKADMWFWKVLKTEFGNLSGPPFPGLECVVLHGNWDTVVSDARFRILQENLLKRGCEMNYSNGVPVQ